MKTLETSQGSLTFLAKYYILMSNNGNHTGHNRIWTVCKYGFDIKIVALNKLRQFIAEDGDMKYGLTYSKIVTPEELVEMIESDEQVNYHNCIDIN
jgi:hypothetical protein